MLTTFDNDDYVHDALQYGAVGYLLKNIPPEELFASIRAVKHGAVLISPSVAKKLIQGASFPNAGVPESLAFPDRPELMQLIGTLTSREKDIIRLISLAYGNREIAAKLHIAEQTVKNQISTIYDKLGVCKRMELMRLFQDLDLSVLDEPSK
jgi:DNA-binding NarL/FixJ family response regulator